MTSIETFDIQSIVVETVSEVFDTMLSMNTEFIDTVSQSYLYGQRILGSIDLVGEVVGMVTIQVGDGFSRRMTGAMLDSDPDEIGGTEEIRDVIGEVCNMIAGGIKSALCDAGMFCELSVPALTSGKDYRTQASPMLRHEYFTFYQGDDPMLVEVGLKMPLAEAANDAAGGGMEAGGEPAGSLQGCIDGFDIKTSVARAVADVFDMMLSMQVFPCSADFSDDAGQSRIVGGIGLSGTIQGRVNICVPEPFSRQMAAAMLDIKEDEIDDMEAVRDVIGEVCNMISGTLKSDLCDAGMHCSLSPPAFTTGSDFEMETLHLSRKERYVHCHGDNPIVVDVGLKPAG